MSSGRNIVVQIAASADGFIARPDGSVDWLDRPEPEGNYGMETFYRSIDACILGRKTYETAVRFGMPDGYPGKENYVFSRTLEPAAGRNIHVVNEPVRDFARRLRGEPGRDIWLVGGAELTGAFLDAGEVDQFLVHVIPVMIGEGIPLAAARRRQVPLELLATERFPDGVVKLHYATARGSSR